jgi:hypothetical protein
MERSLLEELKTLWDELKLQSHLFTMEVSDRWHNLEERFHKLEPVLVKDLEDVGQFNQDFWVGNKEEVQELVEEFRKIKDSL